MITAIIHRAGGAILRRSKEAGVGGLAKRCPEDAGLKPEGQDRVYRGAEYGASAQRSLRSRHQNQWSGLSMPSLRPPNWEDRRWQNLGH